MKHCLLGEYNDDREVILGLCYFEACHELCKISCGWRIFIVLLCLQREQCCSSLYIMMSLVPQKLLSCVSYTVHLSFLMACKKVTLLSGSSSLTKGPSSFFLKSLPLKFIQQYCYMWKRKIEKSRYSVVLFITYVCTRHWRYLVDGCIPWCKFYYMLYFRESTRKTLFVVYVLQSMLWC